MSHLFTVLWVVVALVGILVAESISITHRYIFGFAMGTLAQTLLFISKEI